MQAVPFFQLSGKVFLKQRECSVLCVTDRCEMTDPWVNTLDFVITFTWWAKYGVYSKLANKKRPQGQWKLPKCGYFIHFIGKQAVEVIAIKVCSPSTANLVHVITKSTASARFTNGRSRAMGAQWRRLPGHLTAEDLPPHLSPCPHCKSTSKTSLKPLDSDKTWNGMVLL